MVLKSDNRCQFFLSFLGLVILSLCSFKILDHFREHVDLVFADETGYMVLGLLFPKNIEEGYGPVYSLFYKFLHLFFPDTIDLHYSNLIIQSFLPAFGLFIFLRFFKVNIFISLWLSIGLLASSLTMAFHWWPRISHFTLFLFFFFLIILSRIKDATRLFGFSAFAAFCFSYIRPEAFMTFLALSAWTILWWLIAGRKSRLDLKLYEKLGIAGAILLIIAVVLVIGPATSGGSRLGVALGQHYMYNYIEWNGLPLTDWIYWKDLMEKTFGEPKSLGEFVQNGREEITRHITYNIGHYFRQAGKEVPGVFFPEKVFHFPSFLSWVFVFVFAIARVIYVGPTFFRQLGKYFKRYWPVIFVILAFIGPTVVASFIIYPREHYLIIQLTLVYFLVLLWLLPKRPVLFRIPAYIQTIALLLFGFGTLAAMPTVFDYPTYKVWGEYREVKNVKGIKALRGFGITEQVNMLEMEGGYSAYMSDKPKKNNYKWIIGIYKEDPFYTYIEEEKVNMIYVTEVMADCDLYKNDPEWNDFLQTYQNKGWRKFRINGIKDYVFVKEELLERAGR